jgi:hypothetical protein
MASDAKRGCVDFVLKIRGGTCAADRASAVFGTVEKLRFGEVAQAQRTRLPSFASWKRGGREGVAWSVEEEEECGERRVR